MHLLTVDSNGRIWLKLCYNGGMEATYDPVLDDESPEKKQAYWEVAFGLQAVDGLEPSKYL